MKQQIIGNGKNCQQRMIAYALSEISILGI